MTSQQDKANPPPALSVEIHGSTLWLGDCIEVMAMLDENSTDSIVTDPPYELSNDRKQSPNRVLLEFLFPQDAKLKTDETCCNELPALVQKILDLGPPRSIPSPSSAMPIVTMALDNHSSLRKNDVEHAGESPIAVSDGTAGPDIETQTPEHLGCFFLKLADTTNALKVFNAIGTGFDSGCIRIGLGSSTSSFPSLFAGLASVIFGQDDVGRADDTLSDLIGASGRTTGDAMFCFNLARTSIETFTADEANIFAAILILSGAEFIRTTTATSSLPSMLEARRISMIDRHANRTFMFDLIVHPQNIASNGFMGKAWDGTKIAYDIALWKECLRVLKPGGHLLAFSGSRTYHRMVCAIEDAGFEIRDQIMWLFGSGFPKSHNLEGDHQGWGTALKPAHEPIVVARKPLKGTVADNVSEFGTGVINITECRITHKTINNGNLADNPHLRESKLRAAPIASNFGRAGEISNLTSHDGRWPANVIHDGSEEVLASFPQAAGQQAAVTGREPSSKTNDVYGSFNSRAATSPRGDSGSAARFFYCAKASKEDREEGLAGLKGKKQDESRKEGNPGGDSPRNRGLTLRANHHPTVKPTDLMRYLCRLVTPRNGIVLDPFMGSGSTGKAAVLEGLLFIGIERESEYFEIARRRIQDAHKQPDMFHTGSI